MKYKPKFMHIESTKYNSLKKHTPLFLGDIVYNFFIEVGMLKNLASFYVNGLDL